jgi:hypothetical protein
VTPWGVSTIPPQHPLTPYTKSMNKTPDLNAIMASYTQQVIAEEQRRQAIRDAYAAGRQQDWTLWGSWNISDRH